MTTILSIFFSSALMSLRKLRIASLSPRENNATIMAIRISVPHPKDARGPPESRHQGTFADGPKSIVLPQ